MDKTCKVIVADDEKLVLEGTEKLINEIPGFEVVGLAATGEEALNAIKQTDPQIVVTDIRMPLGNGLWLLEQLNKADYKGTVIIISAYDDKEYLKAAIHNPLVFDYITKPFLKNNLIETVQAAGNYYLNHLKRSGSRMNTGDITEQILRGNVDLVVSSIKDNFQQTDDFAYNQQKALALIADVYSGLYAQKDNSKALLDLANSLQKIRISKDTNEIIKTVEDFLRSRNDNAQRKDVTALVSSCLQLMTTQLADSNLGLANVANQLGVTPNYLSARFSRDMNQSFSSFLSEIRIHAAKEGLHDIRLKVYEVALNAGFSDVGHFNRVFKEHTGMAPLQYREKVLSLLNTSEKR